MKTKTRKKIASTLILSAFIAAIALKLFSNKSQLDKELSSLNAYEQLTPVSVLPVTCTVLEETLNETGWFEPYREVTLVSETQGHVINLAVKTGDQVRKGEILASVDKGLLEQELALALLNLHNAKEDLHRFENLLNSDAVTHQQLEKINLSYQNALNLVAMHKDRLQHSSILAPINGFISSRTIDPGSFITPGMPLMTILQQSQLLFVVQMEGSALNRIVPGQKVQVFPSTFREEILEGVVHEIAVQSALSGRYKVSIRVDNRSCSLKPGMTGMARFYFPKKKIIVLPRKCIVSSILDPSVYLVSGDTIIEKKVDARLLNEKEVLIQKGLIAGERVILSGHLNLAPGSRVQITN